MSAVLLAEIAAARDDLRKADERLQRVLLAIEKAAGPVDLPGNNSFETGLQNPDAFWDLIRGQAGELFPTITQAQIDGIQADLQAGAGKCPTSWMAYCLATDYHETNRTMQPVVEAYWLSEDWRRKNLRYYPWHGRGKVQLTWERNYKRATKELAEDGLHVDLIANPNLALRMDVAAACLVTGSIEGWYTEKRLRDYLPEKPTREQYGNARRVINGTDKADLIAGHAIAFEKALIAGDWR